MEICDLNEPSDVVVAASNSDLINDNEIIRFGNCFYPADRKSFSDWRKNNISKTSFSNINEEGYKYKDTAFRMEILHYC